MCVLPVQQSCDLQQELVGRTALGCLGGEGSPPPPWLPHQLKQQLSAELHEAPKTGKEGEESTKVKHNWDFWAFLRRT